MSHNNDYTELSGTVVQLFFSKPSFCAGRMLSSGRDVSFSVKGFVKVGEPVTIRGKYETTKYGRQFVGTEVVFTLPTNPSGLATWLSWYVPDVGPAKGQKLIDEFGMEVVTLASANPQQLAIAVGIPIDSIHRIAKEWQRYSSKVSAFSELATFGLTQHQVECLYARFKGSAVTILREDPYLLLRETDGFGFKTVDDIARRLGFPVDHPGRKRAAYVTAVADAQDNDGSTAILDTVAVGKACDLLDMPVEEYGPAVEVMAVHADEIGQVRRVTDGTTWHVGLPSAYRHEEYLWKRLAGGREENPYISRCSGSPDFLNNNYRVIDGRTLDDSQMAALTVGVSHKIAFITGGAGSGKTTVCRSIHKFFRDGDIRVMLAAPTGKAAKRLSDVVGSEASTIHRLLGYGPDGRFGHDELNPLPAGVLLADESSMIDVSLSYHLLRAIDPKKTSIVFIGDPNQLPPVGPGAMLRDVLDNELSPVARLNKCHRQAGPLKANCAAILDGRIEPSVSDVNPSPWMIHGALTTPEQVQKAIVRLFDKYLPEWGYDPVTDTQFMTAKHAGPLGTKFLNRICQRLRQRQLGNELPEPDLADEKKPILHCGDKVIQTKNDYQIEVFNGTQGVVVEAGNNPVVRYDDREVCYTAENRGNIELAYVLSVHKSQGSEWPCIVTVCHKSHRFMQTRMWLYTSVTRAQKTCVIIGDDDSINYAAMNDRRDCRGTWLGTFARNEGTRPS